MNHKFISYEPCTSPDDKYLGVASVLIDDKYLVRYKMVATKDGKGQFPAAPSLKKPGTDEYYSTFVIDSNIEKNALDELIRHEVKKAMTRPTMAAPSAFDNSVPF